MKNQNLIWGAVALFTLVMSSAVNAGSCNYVQLNMFAGPFDVCITNTDAARCAEIGTEDDNSKAVANEGDCAAKGAVGTCDLGDNALVYYTGPADGLEIGCGFQGGDWTTAGS